MSKNTAVETAVETTEVETPDTKPTKKEKKKKGKAAKPAAKKAPAKRKAPARRPATGPWQEILTKAADQFGKVGDLATRTAKEKKKAGLLLWDGAVAAIKDWDSDADPSAEVLGNEIMAVLGESRKGDVSKIRTVARASAHRGLNLGDYENLSRAYAAARALSGEQDKKHVEEDAAAEAAIENIEAPATTKTPEGAAAIVLAKGVDEAARLLLDALGKDNTPAHRSLVRALTAETAGRVKPEPKKAPAKKEEKDGAEVVSTEEVETPKAAPAQTKAKPAATKAAPAAAPKAAPAQAKAKPAATKAAPVKKAVARPAVRRG